MEIEAELPEDYDELSPERKVQELEQLKAQIEESSDASALKKRLVEEMIRSTSQEL